ncbi:GNAT family N-acetyltransferase [Mycoplasmatota bacterium]|nr:GNAT family N-acetyltransferase [Mycoplasmatota bacterium]
MRQVTKYLYQLDNGENIEIRLLKSSDSIQQLTRLLNKSYKSLYNMGLKYVAATQDDDTTVRRVQKAYKCFVGIINGKIVATISLYKPSHSTACKWYSQDFVAKFGQFAVLPGLQKIGIGRKLMNIVEHEASKIANVKELALDTAETAYHLIDYYTKKGYIYIETVSWSQTNYRSVILSKEVI